MATRRSTGDACPLDGFGANMDKCQPCRFFRGASLVTGRKGWTIVCNWPRNGSTIEEKPSLFRETE